MKSSEFLQNRSCSFIFLFFLFVSGFSAVGVEKHILSHGEEVQKLMESIGIKSVHALRIYIAAYEGDVEAQYSLAYMHSKGEGVEKNIQKGFEMV